MSNELDLGRLLQELDQASLLLLDAQNRVDPFAPIALDRDQTPFGQLVGGDLLSGVGQLGLEFGRRA